MFVVVISENKFINSYKEHLENLDMDLDFSNTISPKELSPSICDIYNDYLLKRADAVVVLTTEDQFNFYISKVCKTFYKTKKVITSINNSNNKEIFTSIGVLDVVDLNCCIIEFLNKYLGKKE